jgi:hypothetical protein
MPEFRQFLVQAAFTGVDDKPERAEDFHDELLAYLQSQFNPLKPEFEGVWQVCSLPYSIRGEESDEDEADE